MRRVLVTGVSGFVGRALFSRLRADGVMARGTVRREVASASADEMVIVGDIHPETDWMPALTGSDTVIHLAARVHLSGDDAGDSLAAFRAVNTYGTGRLAEQAVMCGVRRLIFVSSLKVNGEETSPDSMFRFSDAPAPVDSYGQSKWEAEQLLFELSSHAGLEVVVVRPPLVYGPGVKGNFARLAWLVRRGLPLPLAEVNNRRSMVALDNLVDLLIRCIDHPAAAGQTFLVSDGEDLSTPQLVQRLGQAMARPVRMFSVPVSLLRTAGRLAGRSGEVKRLVGSLRVDMSHTRKLLGWTPPVSVDEGIRRAVGSPGPASATAVARR
jgi:nucleoside-diphosphate-sugar epimerase